VCRLKHVEPLINFGVINSVTKLHLVGISTESFMELMIVPKGRRICDYYERFFEGKFEHI
jgi:hypothetical protein